MAILRDKFIYLQLKYYAGIQRKQLYINIYILNFYSNKINANKIKKNKSRSTFALYPSKFFCTEYLSYKSITNATTKIIIPKIHLKFIHIPQINNYSIYLLDYNPIIYSQAYYKKRICLLLRYNY